MAMPQNMIAATSKQQNLFIKMHLRSARKNYPDYEKYMNK